MIVQTPVIATQCVGTTELLGENSEYGLMTENSEDGIYYAMKQVLVHSECRNEYSNRIHQRSAAFQKEALLKAIEQIL